MKKACVYHLALAGLLMCGVASAYEVEFNLNDWCTNGVSVGGYEKNIPEGWTYSSSVTSFSILPDRSGVAGVPALKFKFYDTSAGKTGELRMGNALSIPKSEIACDNVVATLMLYVQPRDGKPVDTFQLIATTNGWDGSFPIGGPVPICDDSYETGWKSIVVKDTVKGISGTDNFESLQIGVLATAGGKSWIYGYLHGISVEFKAFATPEKPVLIPATTGTPGQDEPLSAVFDPGVEYGRMKVAVKVAPVEKVSDLEVYGVLSRTNGEILQAVTNRLESSGGFYYEKEEDAARRARFDAGEEIVCSVITKYHCDPSVTPLGEVHEDGFAYEFSDFASYSVSKKGSAWINEFGVDDAGHCYVELCGTTNRSYLSGWQIVLSGENKNGETRAYTNELAHAFDFTTNMVNGVVGIETYRWTGLDDVVLEAAMLELKNPAGVVEFSRTGIAFPAHYQMTGKAKWHGVTDDDWSYDWSGTADDGTFIFGLSSERESFGRVNLGQGFLVPVGTKLYFTTLIEGKGETPDPLPFASISATLEGILNGEDGTTNFVGQTDEATGTAEIKISGYSDDASAVPLTVSVSAFAWKCEDIKTNISLYAESVSLTNFVRSTVAFDDFSVLKDYWASETTIKNGLNKPMYWDVVDLKVANVNERVLQLDTRSGTKGTATLTTKSYMDLRGKRCFDVSFEFRNERNTGVTDCAVFSVALIDVNGTTVETEALANKRTGYEKEEWYSFRQFVQVPADFAPDGRVWIRVQATKNVATTSVYVTLDDLRIAALDSVKINEFKMEEPTGAAFPQELPSNVELDISPLTGGIVSNFVEEVLTSVETNYVRKVAADLVLTINGTEFAVPFSFADGSLTNDVSAAEENVKLTLAPSTITKMTGGFLPGDEVQYYVRVTYDPDDADDSGERDARYYPDNATPTANGWRVENGYAPVVQSLSITDKPALTLVGKPDTTTDGARFTVHGYSANTLTNITVWINGEECKEQPFDFLSTNGQIRVTGDFVIEKGLNASTTYSVKITGVDGKGNILDEAKFDFLTKPKMPDISGTPEDGAYSPTKAFDFYALAEADDVTKLNFHWLLDEAATKSGNGQTNYTDTVEADGPHTVRVYVTDRENNVSPTNSLSWVVDTTKPTKPDIAGTPANGSVTNGVAYDLTAKSTDATLITYHWLMDGVAASTATNFTGAVAPGFASHEVQCYATDQAGNVSETNDWTWTVDTLAPTNLVISGYPANGSVTNGTSFRLTATAMDDMALTYHWSLDGGDEVTTTDEAFEDDVADGYGKHVVTCYATDTAGNVSVTNSWKWTVDTEAPTKPDISGTPMNGSVTNEPNFHLSAKATDKTAITYHWLTNGVAAVSVTNFEGKVTEEGEFVVSCYATDEANNVSETNSVSWTYDRTPPTVPVMSGAPEDGAVTNGTEYGYTATSFDLHFDAFYWSLDGASRVRALPGVKFAGNVADGYAKHTVRVFATDTAGNRSAETNWTWTVDTKKPTDLKLTGLPISDEKIIVTNGFDFAFTASANDDMELTYHWKTNGVEVTDCTSSNFVGQVSEGTNTVSVYAKDVAGNACDPVERMWVVDAHAPTKPVIDGKPVDGAITSDNTYSFSAASTDDTIITYHWSLDERKGAEQTFAGKDLADGCRTVFVYATDEAGNVSETNSWKWTVDTKAPEKFVISGTPANGSVTNEPNFSLTAEAEDATLITYHWLTNGVVAADVTNLVGRVEEEGLFEVKCYATDAAGNISKTNDWSWTFDRTAPTKPVITDNLKKGKITNVEAYDLTAASTDEHLITYHWTLGEKKETVTNFVGSVTSSGEYTDFTAFVYATDEAGNVSETSSISWRLDTKRPSVTLTSTASGHFNKKAAPMEVTATFSEEVTNFTYECVTVQTGTVSNEVKTVEEKKVFRFWVYPEHYGVPSFIDEETVSVSIDANKVWDYAGNGNEASLNEQGEQAPLTRVYDTKSPIVTLSSETPDNFNASFVPLKVTIGVTGKGVTELTQESIVITNGVIAKFEKTDEKQGDDGLITEKTYALEVVPTKEALITVVVPESVLTNMTGNTNPASEPPVRKTYDNTAPQNLAINGEPAQNKVTAATTFDFEATADDLTAMNFHWKLNGVAVTGNETSKYSGTVEKGTNWVTVSATDAAGNTCAEVKRTWVVDFEPPEDLTLSGTPGKMDEIVVTNGTDFAYTASASDETQISYHWTMNGVEVVNNLSTNLVGVAIEGTNTVSVYATDEADNVSKVTNSVTWVVDTIPPKLGELSGTPKKGEIVATNGFNFATFAEDATGLTYHWTLNGKSVSCTTANYVGEVTVDGTYTLTVYVTDEAGNVSPTTNSTWWVVDRIAPTVPVLSGVPADGAITNGTGYGYTATSTDEHLKEFWWALDGGAAEVRGLSEKFKGDVAEGFGKHAVTVYAVDEAGNQSVPTNWTWTVDTVSPTNLVVTGIPPAVTNVAAFSMSASALDDTAISYHWLTNGIEIVSTNLVGTASEGTNTVQVWAEDAAHNVSTTNTIRWVLDTIAPTMPVIDGTPKPKAVTNDKSFSFSATAEDKTALTFFWTVDEQKMTAPAFAGEVDGDGEHTVSVYAADAAGNVSPTNTFSWTLDTKAPDNLVITGTPADGSATNKPNYSLSATAEDMTVLTFHWTLGDKIEAVTNFIGEVEKEGAYEVTCYATDAAGNSSVTNSWNWTFDMTPPTLPVISGTPENGSVTNKPNYDLTAAATDNLTVITYHWMTNGVAAADVTNFVGEVNAEGVYVVSCYATDAADNVSETNFWSWTFDKTPPAALAISGKPEEGDVVATNGFAFAASATDLTRVSYRWTLNGSGGATGENFIGNAPEGTNTVKVTATDEAGNVSAVSRTWVVDTLPPTNRIVFANPGEGVLTNITFFSITAQADDATQVEYFWTTNAVAVEDAAVTTNLTSWSALEGTNTVTVYAKDEAGNVSETNTVRWTVDTIAPEVTLTSETSTNHVINMTDVLKVTATFTEPVVGFTDKSVTVSNGMVTNVVAKNEKVYEVWIAPAGEDVTSLSVQIAAGAVTDRAGNGNVASNELKYKCDVKPPRVVSIESEMSEYPFSPVDLDEDDAFEVTIVFSEAVTNFTKSSVTVTNGTVISVSPSEGAATTYTVRVTPINLDEAEYDISIGIAAGVVNDLAGNGNEPSETLVCKYDYKPPTIPVVSGTPANGATVWGASVNYSLTASGSTDANGVSYCWQILIDEAEDEWETLAWDTNKVEDVVTEPGVYKLRVFAMDDALNPSEAVEWSWTLESGEPPSGVPFGSSVQLKIQTPEVTNVVFTTVDFHPGAESTFALREFELIDSQVTAKEITDLRMQFIVGTNLLDATRWPVKVENFAGYTNGTLTVRVLAEETTDKVTGKPYEELFIFGIDNQDLDK